MEYTPGTYSKISDKYLDACLHMKTRDQAAFLWICEKATNVSNPFILAEHQSDIMELSHYNKRRKDWFLDGLKTMEKTGLIRILWSEPKEEGGERIPLLLEVLY